MDTTNFHTSLTDKDNTQAARHVLWEFDLREHSKRFTDDDFRKALDQVFPDHPIIGLTFDYRVLICRFAQLPPKPWPRTIAGVPCYFTTEQYDLGPTIPIKYLSSSRIFLADDLDLRHKQTARKKVFSLIREFFDEASILITEIQLWDHLLLIVLEEKTENYQQILNRLPSSVAKYPCLYLFESEIGRPKGFPIPANRNIVNTAHISFNSHNNPLCPPIRLSNYHPDLPFKKRLARSGEGRTGDHVWLSGPFSGLLDGTRHVVSEWKVHGQDPHAKNQKWIECIWIYTGQDSGKCPREDICGSLVWNESLEIIGVFQFTAQQGDLTDYSFIVACDALIDAGYTLV